MSSDYTSYRYVGEVATTESPSSSPKPSPHLLTVIKKKKNGKR
jgi:hypothetical protein